MNIVVYYSYGLVFQKVYSDRFEIHLCDNWRLLLQLIMKNLVLI